MDFTRLLGLIFVSLAFIYFLIKFFRKGKTIPGPIGYPFFGVFFHIKKFKGHLEFSNYSRKYGNVCRFKLMGSDIVLVSGLKLIHEVLVTKQDGFSSRYMSHRLDLLASNEPGLVSMKDDAIFRETKKFCLKSFKFYGDGMDHIEELTRKSIEKFFTYISSANGKAIDTSDKIQYLLADIVYSMLLNRSLEEKEILDIIKMSKEFIDVAYGLKTNQLELFPWLRYFGNSAYKVITDYKQKTFKFWSKVIDDRYDGKNIDEISGAIDSMYSQLMKSSLQHTRASFCKTLQSIIVAGFFTTSSSMYNFLALLLNRKDVEKKILEEVEKVVGFSRLPSLKDKEDMPYSEACILEILRYTSVVPFAVPHECDRDMELDGYKIKKGSQVWVNLWDLHHDENVWGDPWEFRPERFLNEEGKLLEAGHYLRRHLLPFGAGRRICLAKQMAKNRLFLFITSLIQNFQMEPEKEDELPEYDVRKFLFIGVVMSSPYKARFIRRGQTSN